MVTIREVARESGVSAATVSHVLNGTRRVEPETAARVRAAIEKLGYRPLREYDRYGLRGIRLAGFFAHGTGMCAWGWVWRRGPPPGPRATRTRARWNLCWTGRAISTSSR